ncbi:MAG: M20/M25/M40 family metallo-hydrolase, partial [Bryobacter sp.]|nr:M20/M25/M40 family metallo-hydrolase [Bryobacter sp.]
CEKAAKYIAGRFDALKLKPPAGLKNYLQPFEVTMNARLGPNNSLQVNGTLIKLDDDFRPFNFSSSGSVSGPVVFAGFGITAPEYHYDDYAGLDVKDKVVLILRQEPQENDEKSVFDGRSPTRHALFDQKAINAKMHGAKAVILINKPEQGETLESFGRAAGPKDAGILMVQMKPAASAAWFAAANKDLKDIIASIDKDLKPQSFAFPESVSAKLTVDVRFDKKTTHNVLAWLPGETDEYIVVGAHYDHLGKGEQFTMAPSQVGTVHPGADDNASGVAGVLELAAQFRSGPKPKRGILFMAFSGEELGLLGSAHYVANPVLPLDKCVAMVNMDMIGRMKENRLIVGGAGSGAGFKALLDKLAAKHPDLRLDYSEQAGFGGSDHTSFTTKQIPVMFFFSGLHADYHKPSDTWDKVQPEDSIRALGFVSDAMQELISGDRPQFVRVVAPPKPMGGGGPGYGAYFGSIPDMSDSVKGVKFADIREGSPAGKAGLKGGDIMVEFDGKKVDNLYDYTFLLRQKKPGDVVKVRVLRGGQPLDVEVTLEQRK